MIVVNHALNYNAVAMGMTINRARRPQADAPLLHFLRTTYGWEVCIEAAHGTSILMRPNCESLKHPATQENMMYLSYADKDIFADQPICKNCIRGIVDPRWGL